MRTHIFTLSSNQAGTLPLVLNHYLFFDPVFGPNFTYPTSAWGRYFLNAESMPPAAELYFSRVGNITPVYQQVIGEFVYQLQQENMWDSLVDGWLLSKNLNAGTGSTVYALKSNNNNGIFAPGVNGKLPTWESTGVRLYNDGTDAIGLGPRIDVPTWTHRVSAPMSISTVFSPFSGVGNTGAGVFGATSWGGPQGQNFGINYDSLFDTTGSISFYIGNETSITGFTEPGIRPLSGEQFIMATAITDGITLSGVINNFPPLTQLTFGTSGNAALTAVAIGYELSAGGSAMQNAFPYDGLINSGFVFNKTIDSKKFYDIFSGTIGLTLQEYPSLDPNINWDIDACVYFVYAGFNNIPNVNKIKINNFIKQLKSFGLWNNMVCWICRSGYNIGSGNIVYALGGDTLYDGIQQNLTWTTSGLQSVSNTGRVITTKKRTGYNARSYYTVANARSGPLSRGRLMYSGFAEPVFQAFNFNCRGMSMAETIPINNSGSQVGAGAPADYINAAGPLTPSTGFVSHAATFGSLTLRNYRDVNLINTVIGGGWASSITDGATLCLMNASDDYGMYGEMALAMDFNFQLSIANLTNLNNIVKSTICSDLGLP